MIRKIIRTILILAAIILAMVVLFFGYLTVREYRPRDIEQIDICSTLPEGKSEINATKLKTNKQYTVMTWNTGYGALGDNADFFMDGGTGVITADEERVKSNVAGIVTEIQNEDPDFILLQEVDLDSKRSHNINEVESITRDFGSSQYSFAYNYKAIYVPYPWPTLGRVESGLLTISDYEMTSADRIQLPIPFAWPLRIANLKRCLAVHRIPVDTNEEGSQKDDGESRNRELVLINLHLEAYDDGEGKVAQTEMLKDFMEAEYAKGNYVVAGGDFNQVFSSVDYSMYPMREELWQCGEIDTSVFDTEADLSADPSSDVDFKDMDSDWKFIMDNKTPTCRSLDQPYQGADKDDFQYYLIDGFILSPNVEVVEYVTKDLGFIYTDHNPVIMKFSLR